MSQAARNRENYRSTRNLVGYLPKTQATPVTYQSMGFRCGLEIHQQLLTDKKLFCRCPAGIYQNRNDFDAELVRHMRPTLSELGEYDGTALMEYKTRKNIYYWIKNNTACTYDIDDTPPFAINPEALKIALEVALLLKTSIVGELHITRKQYLDGSIPTGFQRTAILGINGNIPLSGKDLHIIQLSIEEDSCREVSDQGHKRVYTTDRLGMPLIETVTGPDLKTPEAAASAAQYLRFLTRSTGKVRTGIGAARQDVNVSVKGGTRVEIKGVSKIRMIPRLTHVEGFRQAALLAVQKELKKRGLKKTGWKPGAVRLSHLSGPWKASMIKTAEARGLDMIAVNLPGFRHILSFFCQPGRTFADEISDRLKVIACLEKPNMIHTEEPEETLPPEDLAFLRNTLEAGENDAQLIFRGPGDDMDTALETVEERCLMAFDGVPSETRKPLENGNTEFERVLPGPDRMYPDTDSAPIPITEAMIRAAREDLPVGIDSRMACLEKWGIPEDTHTYLLKRNLCSLMERIIEDFKVPPVQVGTLLGHCLKHIQGQFPVSWPFDIEKIYNLFAHIHEKKLVPEIARDMLRVMYQHPDMDMDSVLGRVRYRPAGREEILKGVGALRREFQDIGHSNRTAAQVDWLMGRLRESALGNMPMRELKQELEAICHA